MMAPVAEQQADRAAANVARALRGEPHAPFRYRNPAAWRRSGATPRSPRCGGFAFSRLLRLGGVAAAPHHGADRLPQPALVLINWAWDYFLYERAVRLIYAREIHTGPAEVPGDAARPTRSAAAGR